MKFLITAGPTREPLDPVRYLSNRSSGKMGYAIATAALEQKHEVILVSGPVSLGDPPGAKVRRVTTAEEMYAAVTAEFPGCDVLVMCAAVCDYRPAQFHPQKLKKERGAFSLTLEPTRDILASLTNQKRGQFIVGFAAETHELEAHAEQKLREKNCDLLVANDVSRAGLGMESDENELLLFFKNGERMKLARGKKTELARALLKKILGAREKSLTKKS